MKPLLYFITPAHERLALSDICFHERAWAMMKLREAGVQCETVIVSDDANLDLAAKYGFKAVEQNNEWLGRRFNDGYEFAHRQGATHVMPIGSDTWLDPEWIIERPLALMAPGQSLANRNYAIVAASGDRRAQIWIPIEYGVHYILNVEDLAHRNYRPCRDQIARGCDTATFRGLGNSVTMVFHEVHELEAVAFQSLPQITNYANLYAKWGRGETWEPFEGLVDVYPPGLCLEMIHFYEEQSEIERQRNLQHQHDPDMIRTQIQEMRLLRESITHLAEELAKHRGLNDPLSEEDF